MNIKDARKQASLSQAELGKRVGLDQSGISRMERGERPITVEMLKMLAKALGVSPSQLLGEVDGAA